jgi:glycosyltransferase involved in cell wall biosynthesis
VQAVAEARRDTDVTLDIVSYVSPDWQRRIAETPGVTLHPAGIPFDRLHALFEGSHVLLFPSHMDTYGYVVLEAMAHGLPVIAPDWGPCRETVENQVSGLLYEPEEMLWRDDSSCRFDHTVPLPSRYLRRLAAPSSPLVTRIADTIRQLGEDRETHERLARGAFESVVSGRLSMSRRAELLAEIYDAAAA